MERNVTSAAHVRDRLANLVCGMRYEDLPEPARREAKRLIVDTIGCAFGGYTGEPAKIVRRTVAELGGCPEATIIGSGARTSCALATFANGTMMRYLDNNDYYHSRDPSHTSGNLAAALAVAERRHASGRDVLLAFVIAYEVQLRLCDFAGRPNLWERGWHHATNMAFASAALAGRLLGLTPVQMANALALAGSHNNTLCQSQRGNIPMMKATAEASIARGGVEAAMLARHGLTGPEEIFEGAFGWGRCVAGEVDFERLTAPVDHDHLRILDTCMKPYAAEMMTQSPIQAAIEVVRDNGLDPRLIRRVQVRFHEYALKKPSWDPKKNDPRDRETADHSFQYCVAVALLDGACGPEQFTAERLASPVVRQLMSNTTLVADPEFTRLWPKSSGAAVRVEMEGGAAFEAVCPYPPGHPMNRLTDAQVEAKFRRLTAGLLTEAQKRSILGAVADLEACDDIGMLMAMLVV
jgi:2-methylcitrate dehydratase